MKVKCVNNTDYKDYLTLDKVYEVLECEINSMKPEYRIISDKGSMWFFCSRFVEVKEFTLSDLKSGMVVLLRNDTLYMVIKPGEKKTTHVDDKGNGYLVGNTGFMFFDYYNDDLTHKEVEYIKDVKPYDIMKVWSFSPAGGFTGINSMTHSKLLWYREIPRKLTLKQLENLLGYPVQIVDN